MPRATTTSDVFNAIAEPRRRQIIELLSKQRSLAVGAIVVSLGLSQPAVSKHLGVLREVGLVSVIKQGQSRVYELNHEQLRPVYDWVKTFERHWDHQLDRIRARAEKRALANSAEPGRSSDKSSSKKDNS
jgi:DNA-binding transcriptional ArsR family regulator